MKLADRITVTMRGLDRHKGIQLVVDGMLKPWRAALRLELTTRQIRRVVVRLREGGPDALISGKFSMPNDHQLDVGVALHALTVIRHFGPTLACEKLRECHGMALTKETGRRLMNDAGMWILRQR